MSKFYDYADPFNCECRAFARLQEAGYDELAVRCYGYLLLSEDNERSMMEQFDHLHLDFNGTGDWAGWYKVRSEWPGKNGRAPPIRGIVKDFGRVDEDLSTKAVRKTLRDIIRLQQLGIIHIDAAHRQLVNGRLADFSTAITIPHFFTTPELHPHLTPAMRNAMRYETFKLSLQDYCDFDQMVWEYNDERREGKKKIKVRALPCADGGGPPRTGLRRVSPWDRVYSLVDPTLYPWKSSTTTSTSGGDGVGAVDGQSSPGRKRARGSGLEEPTASQSRKRRRLDPTPPRWDYDRESPVAARLKGKKGGYDLMMEWVVRGGLMVPVRTDNIWR